MQAESQTPRTDAAALCDRGSFRSDEIVLDLTGGAIVQHEYTKNHRIVYWKMTTTLNFITVKEIVTHEISCYRLLVSNDNLSKSAYSVN